MRRNKAEPAPEVVLPITPMLDMAFQLLTFFIFTYHPSGLEGQILLSMPTKAETAAEKPPPNPTPPEKDPPPKIEADVTVVIRTPQDNVNTGAISEIRVVESTGSTTVADTAELKAHLEGVRKTASNQDIIKVQGDSRLRWESVIEVADVCRKAGFKNVSFVEPPDFPK